MINPNLQYLSAIMILILITKIGYLLSSEYYLIFKIKFELKI